MNLLDHVSITVSDMERCKPFYKAIMGALGASAIWLSAGERSRHEV